MPDRPRRGYILAADTVVGAGGASCPRPRRRTRPAPAWSCSPAAATACTAECASWRPTARQAARVATTVVRFKRLSPADPSAYLAAGEWRGKAGGYAIQGLAAAFVPAINGSYTNVVGLPVAEAVALLEGLGWRAR